MPGQETDTADGKFNAKCSRQIIIVSHTMQR